MVLRIKFVFFLEPSRLFWFAPVVSYAFVAVEVKVSQYNKTLNVRSLWKPVRFRFPSIPDSNNRSLGKTKTNSSPRDLTLCVYCYIAGIFFNSARCHWVTSRSRTSSNETESRQNLSACNIAKSMRSEGNSGLLSANVDRRPPFCQV